MVRTSLVVDDSLANPTTKRSLHFDSEIEFEGHADVPLKGLGSTLFDCSSCLGRVKTSIKRLPHEARVSLGHHWRCKKSKHYLRKLSCVSSSDALPSVTPVTMASYDRSHKTKHKSDAPTGLRNRTATSNSAESAVHRNLKRGLRGLSHEKARLSNSEQSNAISRRDSPSSFWTGNWCIMEPSAVRSGVMNPVNATSLVNNAVYLSDVDYGRRHHEVSRTSSVSNASSTVVNDDIVSERSIPSTEGSAVHSLNFGQAGTRTRSNNRRSFVHDSANLNSSMFSQPPSSGGTGILQRMHRTRWSSSSSSHFSSPDVQLSDYDAHSPQSPNLSRATSPGQTDGYSGSEFPLFRSYRDFSYHPSEEIQEYSVYGGLSEHQVFIWEPNTFLHGTDRFRDLRLDIDNMSYEDLLALEETMGTVNTGLDKTTISRCVRSKIFNIESFASLPEQDSDLKCSICQVEFEDADDLGILDCGHKHHFLCIEEWLLQKNLCPICKSSATKS